MIILDQEKLDQFFKAVSSGFVTTRKEILLFFVALAFILLFLIIYYFMQRGRMHRRLFSQSGRRYAELIGQHNLTSGEVKLIEAMAKVLPPDKQKYLLLTNQHLFNVCAGKLQAKVKVSEPILASLRLKLGFRLRQPEEIPASSVELPPGTPVHLIVPGEQGIRGRIANQDPRGATIALEGDIAALSAGTSVRVYFKNRTGVFSFPSRIVNQTRCAVLIQHSEEIKRYQRRNYYRRKMHLSVFVRLLHTKEKTYRSTLLDLGGGGASLGNPQNHFKAGDLLELSFSSTASDFRIPAKVVRTSKDSSVLHVQFESIAESVRDRIIGSLYNAVAQPG